MRKLILALSLIATPVLAQQPPNGPTQDQMAQGFQQQILAQFQEAAALRAQLSAAAVRIAALEAAARAAPPPVDTPKDK